MKTTKECHGNLARCLVAGVALFIGVGCEEVVRSSLDEPPATVEPTPTGAPSPAPTASPSPTRSPSPSPSPSPTRSPSPTPTSGTSLYTGPAELEKYVVKFVDDAKAQGVDVLPYMKNPKLVLKIQSLDSYGSSTIGVCVSSSTKREVSVDPDFWTSASEARRELLMHHELGHCVLDRRHRSDLLSSGNYASLMYPSIMPSRTYTSNYDYYQDELFSPQYRGWELPQDVEVIDVCTPGELN